MKSQRSVALQQIGDALSGFEEWRVRSKLGDCSDLPEIKRTELITALADVIVRFSASASIYRRQLDDAITRYGAGHFMLCRIIPGVVHALRHAYEKGYIEELEQLVRGDLFSDYLDMAAHLLEEGYKDASAVIAGSTLEEHLRQLCNKNGIPINDSDGKPRKADSLNSDLKNATIYTIGDLKLVTAWLDIRNNAAHGRYSEYTAEKVDLMVQGIREFIARVPA